MTESTRGPKPDGSAYKEHMDGSRRRNGEARKRGKARREAREHEDLKWPIAPPRCARTPSCAATKHRGKAQLKD